jgi:hypothetical protein
MIKAAEASSRSLQRQGYATAGMAAPHAGFFPAAVTNRMGVSLFIRAFFMPIGLL